MTGTKLIDWHDYPVFPGCTDAPRSQDETFHFQVAWNGTHYAQVTPPDPAILYRENRAFGLGQVWADHYRAFAWFVQRQRFGSALEIGGGNGRLIDLIHPDADVEPHPQYDPRPGTTTHRNYFEAWEPDRRYQCIYASHLIEHVFDLEAFFAKVGKALAPGGVLCLACPDFDKSLQHTHLNAFTSDHINYFSPRSLDRAARKYGFQVVQYEAFRDHSQYVALKRIGDGLCLTELPQENTELAFRRYVVRVQDLVNRINAAPYGAYLYGAHSMTVNLIRFGVGTERLSLYVLDNEKTKHGRRLVGTDLVCAHPGIIRTGLGPVVCLYAGAYGDEIREQLVRIDPTVRIVEAP